LRTGCWGRYLSLWGTRWQERRRLRIKERYALYSSLNTIWLFKIRRMWWEEHVTHMGDKRGRYKVFVWGHEGRNHLEDLGVDGMIILKWISKKWDGESWTGLLLLSLGAGDGACECTYESSDSIKCGNFLTRWRLLAAQEGLCCMELVS
jgi:hypothetical protein